MKPIDQQALERKLVEAAAPAIGHDLPMIRSQMNGRDWLSLLVLAPMWGGAFFAIGVGVRYVPPLTYVWLRLSSAAAGMWLFLKVKGQPPGLPRQVWGSILL